MTPPPLTLVLPDWSGLDTIIRSPLPFALWTIGDQCLLHHWLDFAVNRGMTEVHVFAADRPAAVRRLLEESSLWPLKLRFTSIASTADAPTDAISVDWLPGATSPPAPNNGWELAACAAAIEKSWLDRMATEPDFPLINIGFSCRIHPEAKLIPPYFIGDHVLIGPDCEIGPHAVIGNNSVISGANLIRNSHLSDSSFLGPVTALENCRLERGVLFNLKHQARLDDLETHLVSTLESAFPVIPFRDRIHALWLYCRMRSVETPPGDFLTFDGKTLMGDPSDLSLRNRIAWLPLVWKGELPLYGVLPRTKEQLETLDPDWKMVIRHTPTGVFSYADLHGCHSPSHPDEALHAVYQASLPPQTLIASLRKFTRSLTSSSLTTSHSQA